MNCANKARSAGMVTLFSELTTVTLTYLASVPLTRCFVPAPSWSAPNSRSVGIFSRAHQIVCFVDTTASSLDGGFVSRHPARHLADNLLVGGGIG